MNFYFAFRLDQCVVLEESCRLGLVRRAAVASLKAAATSRAFEIFRRVTSPLIHQISTNGTVYSR